MNKLLKKLRKLLILTKELQSNWDTNNIQSEKSNLLSNKILLTEDFQGNNIFSSRKIKRKEKGIFS